MFNQEKDRSSLMSSYALRKPVSKYNIGFDNFGVKANA